MEHEESWDDIYREFDDHCNRAGRSDGDWPSIHHYWERGGRSGRLLFHLLFTKMHAVAQAGDDAMRTHFPKLEHWITASCILDLEQQWELICEDLALRFPQGASSQVLENEYFDKFPWLFVRQLDADIDVVFSSARALGAQSPAICPTTRRLVADVNAPCVRCHCGVHERFGTFVVGDPLGEGGQATVHRAYSFTLDDVVALKRLHRKHEADSSWEQRSQQLLREGAKARMAKHPHIVPAVDSGCFGETPYIAYSLVTGVTLQQWIEGEMSQKPRFLTSREAAAKIAPLARALEAAHYSEVVHCDIKPSNVLVDSTKKFLLTDFGLGRVITPQYSTQVNLVGEERDRKQADIEAIGRLLRFCTEGLFEPLSRGRSLRSDFQAIVERCFSPTNQTRYPTAGELAYDLERYVDGFPIVARPPGPVRRLWLWCRREPLAALAIAMLVVFAIFAVDSRQRILAMKLIADKERDRANVTLGELNQTLVRVETRERSIQDIVEVVSSLVYQDRRILREFPELRLSYTLALKSELQAIVDGDERIGTSGSAHVHRLLAALEIECAQKESAIRRLTAARSAALLGYDFSSIDGTSQSDAVIMAGQLAKAEMALPNPDVTKAKYWLDIALTEAENVDWSKKSCQDPRVFLVWNFTTFALRNPEGAQSTLLADAELLDRLKRLLVSGETHKKGVTARISLAILLYVEALADIARSDESSARDCCRKGVQILEQIPVTDFRDPPDIWRQWQLDYICVLTVLHDAIEFGDRSATVDDRISRFRKNFAAWQKLPLASTSPETLLAISAAQAYCAKQIQQDAGLLSQMEKEFSALREMAAAQVLCAVKRGGRPLIPLDTDKAYEPIKATQAFQDAVRILDLNAPSSAPICEQE